MTMKKSKTFQPDRQKGKKGPTAAPNVDYELHEEDDVEGDVEGLPSLFVLDARRVDLFLDDVDQEVGHDQRSDSKDNDRMLVEFKDVPLQREPVLPCFAKAIQFWVFEGLLDLVGIASGILG